MKIWFAFLSLEKIKNNHVLVQHSKMTLNYLRERVPIKGFFMMVSLQASKTVILSIKIRFLVLALGKPFKTQIWHQTLKCCVRKKQILCRNKTGCFYVLLTTLLYCTYNYESTRSYCTVGRSRQNSGSSPTYLDDQGRGITVRNV